MVAMTNPETPIVCNGFKDNEFIEMALLAQQLGRTVIPVVEKVSELDLIMDHAPAARRASDDRNARQTGHSR